MLEFRTARRPERAAPALGPRQFTAEEIGRSLLPLLSSLRLQSLSLHNGTGELLWLSEGVFGPDENGYVLDALDQFAEKNGPPQLERRLDDGRRALFLCARTPLGERCGLACVIAEARSNQGIETELDAAQIAVAMRQFSMLLAPPLSRPQPGVARAPQGKAVPAARTAAAARPFAALIAAAPEAEPELPPPAAAAPPVARSTQPEPPKVEPPVLAPATAAPARAAAAAAAARAPVARGNGGQGPLQARRYLRLRPGGTTRRYEIDLPPDSPASLTSDLRLARRVIEHLDRERERYLQDLSSFTVPLCASAVLSPSFQEQLMATAGAAKLPDGMLGFSLPSAAWSHESHSTGRFMQACAQAHCFVTLDEFNLGRSGFDLLRLPALRCLKLDPALVGAIGSDKFSQASVAAIVQAARVLGLHCVAVNADAPQTREWLASAGIEFADQISRGPAAGATRKGVERLTLDGAVLPLGAPGPRP
ncbi:MAG TPA: EAL domain-containing protein [Steroidobacteraceae bacterium]|nr:EAL domain-containing protein [Steroidobacteraceae bacterium]